MVRRTIPALLALAASSLAPPLHGTGAQPPETSPPRLVVLISLDQFRADYLDKVEPWFSEGGFRRLRADGVEFTECHYRYAVTKTAPGHATIATGVCPNVSGILANEWRDPETFVKTTSVEDANYDTVGNKETGRSPRRLQVDALGDFLKKSTGGKARVISISGKDRSAILMGGHHPDAAYWQEGPDFVTSTYYMNALPDWVTAFNAERRVDAWFGSTWEKFLPEADYKHLGPDDAPGEENKSGLGTTFPHKIDGGSLFRGSGFYSAFDSTPFRTEVLETFVERAVAAEHLGEDEVTDLLCIGVSQTDSAGHSYGPDSHEMFDSIVRLDREIAKLLTFLDARVGLANCLVVVTSDHGVGQLPERLQVDRPELGSRRLDFSNLEGRVRDAMQGKFGSPPGKFWCLRDGYGIRFDRSALKSRGISEESAAGVAKAALLEEPGIGWVYTRAELLGSGKLDAFGEAERLSYYPPLGPDLAFIPKACCFDRANTGVDHGTPHEYDTHVPFLIFGGGLDHAVHDGRVGVDSIVPTIAKILGIPTASTTPSAL